MPAPIVAYWEAFPLWITFDLAVLAALLLVIAIWWLWWRLPKREAARLALKVRDAKARADVEDNYRKTVGQALGGAAVLLGAGTAYLQFSQQQRASDLQFSQQQRASHDLLISNQVSKGFEQLGNKDAIVVRLGGIYALEGVMNNSTQYHQAVLEGLSAFVRENAKLPTTPGPLTQGPPPTDVQAALTVIGRRSAGQGGVDLPKTNIAGADLRKANLTGAGLREANLTGADLTHANLSGADLFSATLTGADLRGTDLTGADLTHVNLSGAVLSNTDLTGADLSGADLTGAHLFIARLTHANLSGADLSDTDLTGADLSGADLTGAGLAYANLTGAKLTGAQIRQKQLDGACGLDVLLPPGLTLKPCPSQSSP